MIRGATRGYEGLRGFEGCGATGFEGFEASKATMATMATKASSGFEDDLVSAVFVIFRYLNTAKTERRGRVLG